MERSTNRDLIEHLEINIFINKPIDDVLEMSIKSPRLRTLIQYDWFWKAKFTKDFPHISPPVNGRKDFDYRNFFIYLHTALPFGMEINDDTKYEEIRLLYRDHVTKLDRAENVWPCISDEEIYNVNNYSVSDFVKMLLMGNKTIGSNNNDNRKGGKGEKEREEKRNVLLAQISQQKELYGWCRLVLRKMGMTRLTAVLAVCFDLVYYFMFRRLKATSAIQTGSARDGLKHLLTIQTEGDGKMKVTQDNNVNDNSMISSLELYQLIKLIGESYKGSIDQASILYTLATGQSPNNRDNQLSTNQGIWDDERSDLISGMQPKHVLFLDNFYGSSSELGPYSNVILIREPDVELETVFLRLNIGTIYAIADELEVWLRKKNLETDYDNFMYKIGQRQKFGSIQRSENYDNYDDSQNDDINKTLFLVNLLKKQGHIVARNYLTGFTDYELMDAYPQISMHYNENDHDMIDIDHILEETGKIKL